MIKRFKTYLAKPSEVRPNWQVIDASGQTLGRLASRISRTLQGKDKPTYTPHVLTGDYVVVINADKIKVTGNKMAQKTYYRHSGYVGNLRQQSLGTLHQKHPDRVIRLAVKGMLPANKLGREMLGRLRIFSGDSHKHDVQVSKSQ